MATLDTQVILNKVRSAGRSAWASAMGKAVKECFVMMKDYTDLGPAKQIDGGLTEATDDADAATKLIPVNGLYKTGSIVKIRVS